MNQDNYDGELAAREVSLKAFLTDHTIEFSAAVVPVVAAGKYLLLLQEDQVQVLEGKVYCDIAQAISNGFNWSESRTELTRNYSVEQLDDAIATLVEHGALSHPTTEIPTGHQAFWAGLGGLAHPNRSISTKLLCTPGQGMVVQALQASGLKIEESGELLIVTTDDYLNRELSVVNRSEKRPWLLAKPVGHTIFVGPLFVPGKTACWACLAQWLRTNRWQQAAFLGWGENDYPFQPSVTALPAALALAAGMIATAAAVWAAQGNHPALEDRVLAFDTRTLHQVTHPLRRRLQCPICGIGATRVTPPDLYDLVSPVTGVVSAIDVTNQAVGGFFHARGRFVLPLPVPGSRPLIRPGTSAGTGATKGEAEVTCIAEAAERYSTTHRGNEPYVRMRCDPRIAIPPCRILLFSENQYRDRDEWNSTFGEEHLIPEPVQDDDPILWTPARSLLTGRVSLVPAGCAYLWYPFPYEPRYAIPDSNGCATGRSREEAVLHGLLELIERDSLAIWWYNRLPRPALNLEAFADPAIAEAIQYFESQERGLYLLDLTSDLEVPVYAAVAPRKDGSDPLFACASHMTPGMAARKAVAEVSQIWFWRTYGDGAGEISSRVGNLSLSHQNYLKPNGFKSPPRGGTFISIESALQHCVRQLGLVDIEPLVVDLTRSDLGVPAVRVIAPGLRHYRARFAPGRLFEVPVKMGWLSRVKSEKELNPIPCSL